MPSAAGFLSSGVSPTPPVGAPLFAFSWVESGVAAMAELAGLAGVEAGGPSSPLSSSLPVEVASSREMARIRAVHASASGHSGLS